MSKWLISHPEAGEPHSTPLIQVFFTSQFDNDVFLHTFRFMSPVMDDLLKRYAEIPEKIEEYRNLVKSDRELYFWKSTLDVGMRIAKTNKNGLKIFWMTLKMVEFPKNNKIGVMK